MNTPFIILGIAGSLRKASFNRAALRAAQQLVPDGVSLEIFDLDNAAQRFDEKGNLKDEDTQAHIRDLLVALVAWAKCHEGGRGAASAGA